MMEFLDDYEKLVKPELEPKVEVKNEDELFEIEAEVKKEEPKPQTFSEFNEDALIEKISAKILEKLSNKKEEVE